MGGRERRRRRELGEAARSQVLMGGLVHLCLGWPGGWAVPIRGWSYLIIRVWGTETRGASRSSTLTSYGRVRYSDGTLQNIIIFVFRCKNSIWCWRQNFATVIRSFYDSLIIIVILSPVRQDLSAGREGRTFLHSLTLYISLVAAFPR